MQSPLDHTVMLAYRALVADMQPLFDDPTGLTVDQAWCDYLWERHAPIISMHTHATRPHDLVGQVSAILCTYVQARYDLGTLPDRVDAEPASIPKTLPVVRRESLRRSVPTGRVELDDLLSSPERLTRTL